MLNLHKILKELVISQVISLFNNLGLNLKYNKIDVISEIISLASNMEMYLILVDQSYNKKSLNTQQEMNILQDLKQNEFHQQPKMSKSSSLVNNKKPSSKSSNSYEIEMHIGIAYNQILSAIKENGFSKDIKLPEDGVKAVEKLELIKRAVMTLVEKAQKGKQSRGNTMKQNSGLDESNMITCTDCQNYENNLQKLQNEVRQHIRLQQQLKIYQQSMQEKIEELKKEKTQVQKKYEDLKKKAQEQKHSSTNNTDKLHKLQYENQKLKTQLKQFKQLPLDNSKKIKGYDTRERDRMSEREKENRVDWAHRMSSINKKDDKQATKDKIHTATHTERTNANQKTDRKSVDKRADSSDRWRMSGARSTKLMNFNQKIIQQKNKEERKKVIQSKFQYRR